MITRLLIALFFLPLSCLAQQTTSVNIERVVYTDNQLAMLGLQNGELARYKELINGIEGIWWPNLSPVELLMYSARSEVERSKYAKRYLRETYPKARAEADTQIAMRRAAYQIVDERKNGVAANSDRGAIFVNINCSSCKARIDGAIGGNKMTDIYFVNLDRDGDINKQMIAWVKDAGLPPKSITVNDGDDLWLKNKGIAITDMEVIR